MAQVVVLVGENRIAVEGRAAVMIAYLAEHAQRVNVAEKGAVTFNFCATDITPEIRAIDTPMTVS